MLINYLNDKIFRAHEYLNKLTNKQAKQEKSFRFVEKFPF